ncbi:hypothetical protein QET93_007795 [Akkermansia sp. N21116]|uniref:hypothetical protein n=1 Tax=Akkermansia sp. N21116 TaxID=3040764 RepID=UPI00244EB027|nr:hypothetical protein [Akkermansia sp. N21116]WPX39438.1 hypothetical protein QET93_007795 [Akkermansia sp. N21116]
MTTQKAIDDIAQWIRDHVAGDVEYKVPPASGRPNSKNYGYTLAHPAVLTMFDPPGDDDTIIAPCIVVQMTDGEHDVVRQKGELNIRLVHKIWNPGLHTPSSFTPNAEGWRDLDSFIEVTRSRIEQVLILNGHRVRTETVQFGFMKMEQALVDNYPFFFGHVSFSIDFFSMVRPAILENI